METISVRELQQHASAALRRVEGGETLGVTERRRLIAVLAPAPAGSGTAALVATGRVQPAAVSIEALPDPVPVALRSADLLDDLRPLAG
jgi:antitoxin (DNA-binding transcriptional repressor) of toxin-antitoxin stability system